MDSHQLTQKLRGFTGTETWFRHQLNRNMLYTEGVQFFAEAAGCYWFLDIAATEYMQLQATQPFLLLVLESVQGKAIITVEDGDGSVIVAKHLDFTSCPEGRWCFYLTNNTMLLPTEY